MYYLNYHPNIIASLKMRIPLYDQNITLVPFFLLQPLWKNSMEQGLANRTTRERVEVINETKYVNAIVTSYDLIRGVRTVLKYHQQRRFSREFIRILQA